MKYTLFILSIAAVTLLVLVSCASQQGATTVVTAPRAANSADATAASISEFELDLGVDDISDLGEFDSENQAIFSDSDLAALTKE